MASASRKTLDPLATLPAGAYRYLFGPVPSRRLGNSLGIDLFIRKICNFNCPYCECGPTVAMPVERSEFVPFDEVVAELRRFFASGDAAGVDVLTFSGNGEPTLYSRLGELIRVIRTLTGTPVAVITNSALIMRADVRAELALADIVVPSLDAVTQDVMRRINRSHPTILASEMIDGLVRFRDEFAGRMDLEIFFCKGINDDPREVALLADAARRIRPDRVQLNTVDRPPAFASAKPLSPDEMQAIRVAFDLPNVEVVARPRVERPAPVMPAEDQVLSLVLRRGVDEDDLIETLGLPGDEAHALLARLAGEGKIVRVEFDGRAQYRRAG
ncbi:radical SAM protein [bacterium]|nr:radical SAM protein [bacterium]